MLRFCNDNVILQIYVKLGRPAQFHWYKMSYSPVGDTVAIINITWQVYNKIYVVARDAPREYRELLADLRVFSDQVKIIRDRFEGSTDAPAGSLRAVLRNSSRTLVEFKEKLAKYSDLGNVLSSLHVFKILK